MVNFEAFRAFNGVQANLGSMQQGWLASSSDLNPWLAYEFAAPATLNSIWLETANNSTSATVTAYIEGMTSEGVWENCLQSGDNVNLTFTQSTYTEYSFNLNGGEYTAIRIRGTTKWYTGSTACTISRMQVYGDT